MFFNRPDIVEQLNLSSDLESVQRIRNQRLAILEKPAWKSKVDCIESLPDLNELESEEFKADVSLDADAVSIGTNLRQTELHKKLEFAIETLMPWRKGPFNLFGCPIDSEWRSNLKWDRIAPAIGLLEGKRVLDVGCGNGYYMFRAAAHDPQFVLGLDPSPAFLLQFELIQKYLRNSMLQMELLGFEHLELFPKQFDVTFCMGILYHHSDPVRTLRDLRQTLRIGGIAVIESQAITGNEPIALFPPDRYAKARNVFFVPTASCLVNWIRRAGFDDVELVSFCRTTSDEQRKTRHMVFESLADFLDPDDEQKTIEGHPAPHRAVVIAKRNRD